MLHVHGDYSAVNLELEIGYLLSIINAKPNNKCLTWKVFKDVEYVFILENMLPLKLIGELTKPVKTPLKRGEWVQLGSFILFIQTKRYITITATQ